MRVVYSISNNDGIPVKYNGETVGKAYIQMVVLDTKEDEIKSMLRGTQQSMSIEIARNNT